MIEDRYYVERGWDGGDWVRTNRDGYATSLDAIVVRDRMRRNEEWFRGKIDGFDADITYRVVRCTREVIG